MATSDSTIKKSGKKTRRGARGRGSLHLTPAYKSNSTAHLAGKDSRNVGKGKSQNKAKQSVPTEREEDSFDTATLVETIPATAAAATSINEASAEVSRAHLPSLRAL